MARREALLIRKESEMKFSEVKLYLINSATAFYNHPITQKIFHRLWVSGWLFLAAIGNIFGLADGSAIVKTYYNRDADQKDK